MTPSSVCDTLPRDESTVESELTLYCALLASLMISAPSFSSDTEEMSEAATRSEVWSVVRSCARFRRSWNWASSLRRELRLWIVRLWEVRRREERFLLEEKRGLTRREGLEEREWGLRAGVLCSL